MSFDEKRQEKENRAHAQQDNRSPVSGHQFRSICVLG
jgi:hypothetical protein